MDTLNNVITIDWSHEDTSARPSHPIGSLPDDSSPRNTWAAPAATGVLPSAIMSSWTDMIRSGISERLYDRLVRIALQPSASGTTVGRPLREASLRRFLRFWSEVSKDASEPELSLAPDGSIHAEWFRSNRQRLDILFAEPRALYGLFANGTIAEGADTVDAIAASMKAHRAKPLSWSAE